MTILYRLERQLTPDEALVRTLLLLEYPEAAGSPVTARLEEALGARLAAWLTYVLSRTP